MAAGVTQGLGGAATRVEGETTPTPIILLLPTPLMDEPISKWIIALIFLLVPLPSDYSALGVYVYHSII